MPLRPNWLLLGQRVVSCQQHRLLFGSQFDCSGRQPSQAPVSWWQSWSPRQHPERQGKPPRGQSNWQEPPRHFVGKQHSSLDVHAAPSRVQQPPDWQMAPLQHSPLVEHCWPLPTQHVPLTQSALSQQSHLPAQAFPSGRQQRASPCCVVQFAL